MRVEFRFNGASQVILLPENARDKEFLRLFRDGRPNLRFKSTAGEEVIIEAEPNDELERAISLNRGMTAVRPTSELVAESIAFQERTTAADTEAATSVGTDAAREVTDMGGRE